MNFFKKKNSTQWKNKTSLKDQNLFNCKKDKNYLQNLKFLKQLRKTSFITLIFCIFFILIFIFSGRRAIKLIYKHSFRLKG